MLENSMKQKEQSLQTREKEINKIIDQVKHSFDLKGDLDLSAVRKSIDTLKHTQQLHIDSQKLIQTQEQEIQQLKSRLNEPIHENISKLRQFKRSLEGELAELNERVSSTEQMLVEKQQALKK